jgi:ribA/ribD-fused uncharacterized protein
MNEPITHFKGEFATFSNFWPCSVEFEGAVYCSVEHAYQAAKSLDPEVREKIRSARMANEAKKLGGRVKLRFDWEEAKLGIMEQLLRQKFSQREFAELLFDTETRELVEGNYWHDNFWGQCSCSKHVGQGQNWLGKILMKIRGEARI